MPPITLTDIQWLNVNTLDVIRQGLRQDATLTGHQFGLSQDQAERMASISQRELWGLVLSMGDTALFVPRSDLLELLELPAGLAGPISLARAGAATPLR